MVIIYAPHFVAGHDNHRIAPIISYMRGWTHERIFNYVTSKGWEFSLQVTIKNVVTETVTKGKNSWGKAVVTYDGDKGEKKQNVVSFKNPEVYKVIEALKSGDVVDVKLVKDGDFWQWAEVTKLGGGASKAPTAGRVTGSNYETPEERKFRQLLIVRQSSIASAIARAAQQENPAGVDILELAQSYVDFVYGETDLFDQPNDLDNDIPF